MIIYSRVYCNQDKKQLNGIKLTRSIAQQTNTCIKKCASLAESK